MSDKSPVDPGWTNEQREFVRNLQDVGARNPKAAVKIDRTMALPKAELQSLLDSGAVVEVSSSRFYTTLAGRRERLEEAMAARETASGAATKPAQPFDAAKLVKTILFWILFILIPIAVLQLSRRG